MQSIGGERVDVEVLLGQGQNPHAFDPSPRTVARLGEADIFFRIGAPYESTLIDRLAELFDTLPIVNTSGGSAVGEDHHTWLDPELVKRQAGVIQQTLTELDPDGAGFYRANLEAFHNSLDSLNSVIGKMLAPYRGREVYVYHPAFGYFLGAYGLRQVAVQHDGHEPSARELASLVERMRAGGVRAMFVQPEFPSPVADALSAALGCRIVRLDPLAADYMDNMGRMAALVAGALAESTGSESN